MRKVLTYRTRVPRLLQLRFTIPLFVVVLILALLLGAALYWAAAAAALATIATEAVIDAVWRRRHRSVPDQHH
jgi:hypothetical protein